jgi:hypothetical protein
MPKRASAAEKAAPHVHAYGSWRTVLVHFGHGFAYPSVRECECGAKQVKHDRDE